MPRGGIISLFYMIHGFYRFLDSQECLFQDDHFLHVVSLSNHRHVSMCYKSDATRCFTQSFRSPLNAGDFGPTGGHSQLGEPPGFRAGPGLSFPCSP